MTLMRLAGLLTVAGLAGAPAHAQPPSSNPTQPDRRDPVTVVESTGDVPLYRVTVVARTLTRISLSSGTGFGTSES